MVKGSSRANAVFQESFYFRVLGHNASVISLIRLQSGCIRLSTYKSRPSGPYFTVEYVGNVKCVKLANEMMNILCQDADSIKLEYIQQTDELRAKIDDVGDVSRFTNTSSSALDLIMISSVTKIFIGLDGEALIVGTNKERVAKAKEIIEFIKANPEMDAVELIFMLLGHYKKYCSDVLGSGGPMYTGMPNNGLNMTEEIEFILCSSKELSNVCGPRNGTLNDIVKRTGCNISIDSAEIKGSEDKKIRLSGTNAAVQMAQYMINEILKLEMMHPFAFGNGHYGPVSQH